MPLPPLPANNTDRAWLKYTSMGIEHELCFRAPAATPQADVIAMAVDLATYLKTLMLPTDAFIGLRHADSGSNLSFPLAWTNIVGTLAVTPELQDEVKFISITGRSLGGYRCRMTFFTPVVNDTQAWRIASSAGFVGAADALEPSAVAVDGNPVIWNQYINTGYNAYWQRERRSS
jgi:hypothetical protein